MRSVFVCFERIARLSSLDKHPSALTWQRWAGSAGYTLSRSITAPDRHRRLGHGMKNKPHQDRRRYWHNEDQSRDDDIY